MNWESLDITKIRLDTTYRQSLYAHQFKLYPIFAFRAQRFVVLTPIRLSHQPQALEVIELLPHDPMLIVDAQCPEPVLTPDDAEKPFALVKHMDFFVYALENHQDKAVSALREVGFLVIRVVPGTDAEYAQVFEWLNQRPEPLIQPNLFGAPEDSVLV